MNTPGIFNLGDVTVTSALTDSVITLGSSAAGAVQAFIDRLNGMTSVSVQATFVYGAGGTSVAAVVQTSLDGGVSWLDVCRFNFTTVNAKKIANIVANGAVAPAAASTLSDEGAGQAVLGDRLRCKITSVGTYSSNTSLSMRVSVR